MSDFIRKNIKYGILVILVFFIFINIPGIFYNYGLALTVGDESVIMAATLKMIASNSWRPAFPTNYYFPIISYIYLPFYVVLLVVLRFFVFATTEALVSFGITDFAKMLPMARFVSVLFATISIYLVFRICNKLFRNRFISLSASYMLATSLMFVQLSHFARAWIPQVFFILLSFYFIVDLYQKNNCKLKDYFRIAALTGLSLGSHMVGVLIYLPFIVVHYINNKKQGLVKIFIKNKFFWTANIVLVFFLPTIYLLNPYGFSNYLGQTSEAVISQDKNNTFIVEESFDLRQGIEYYIKVLFEYEPILFFVFVLSLWFLYKKNKEVFFIIFSFIGAYYMVIGLIMGSTHVEPRYILPIVPFMAIVAAFGVYYIYQKINFSKKIKITLLAVLFLALLYLPVMWSWLIIQPSTRIMARDWIYDNVENESGIVLIDKRLEVNENKKTLEDYRDYNEYFFNRKRRFLLSEMSEKLPIPNYYVLIPELYNEVPKELLDNEFEYMILSWWNKGDYIQKSDMAEKMGFKLDNSVKQFPENINDEADRMDIANNMRRPFYYLSRMKTTGPYIAIYKIKN